MYRITLTRSACKELHSLPTKAIKRIREKIGLLAETPRPPSSKKLKGTSEDLWPIRIVDYRVLYGIHDAIKVIEILKIAHRKDVYE
jgi:mRNA interferase RelE/StbE